MKALKRLVKAGGGNAISTRRAISLRVRIAAGSSNAAMSHVSKALVLLIFDAGIVPLRGLRTNGCRGGARLGDLLGTGAGLGALLLRVFFASCLDPGMQLAEQGPTTPDTSRLPPPPLDAYCRHHPPSHRWDFVGFGRRLVGLRRGVRRELAQARRARGARCAQRVRISARWRLWEVSGRTARARADRARAEKLETCHIGCAPMFVRL